MNETIGQVFVVFLYILLAAIVVRSLLTWFPVSRDNQYARLLNTVTEPLLDPVRRLLPRTGVFDFSSMVVMVLLLLMISVVRRATQA